MDKLAEAEYFLREMRRVQHQRHVFIYELSAFTGACKSVAYYLRGEYGQAWYKKMQDHVIRGEFKHVGYYLQKRDSNVHSEPLDVLRETHLEFDEELPDNTRFWLNSDQYGNLMSITTRGEDPNERGDPIAFTATHRYYFPDGEASGQDVLVECELCLRELRRIVLEAQANAKGLSKPTDSDNGNTA